MYSERKGIDEMEGTLITLEDLDKINQEINDFEDRLAADEERAWQEYREYDEWQLKMWEQTGRFWF